MKILISIRPEYAEKIFSGKKQFEFRRNRFRREISAAVVYVSSPVKRIVGEFTVSAVLEESLDRLWELTGHGAGGTKEEFLEYFHGKKTGIAIQIGRAEKYKTPINPYENDADFHPPQSFRYLYDISM